MNDPYGQRPEKYRTPPAVWLTIVAALCLIGGLVLQRAQDNENSRQIDNMVDQLGD